MIEPVRDKKTTSEEDDVVRSIAQLADLLGVPAFELNTPEDIDKLAEMLMKTDGRRD